MVLGHLDEAEMYFEAAKRRDPSVEAEYYTGVVHYYRQRFERARQSWESVVARAPERAMYRSALGDAYSQLGQHERARAQYQELGYP